MAATIDLSGKTAFVTGSTRGIGHAVAVALYQAGARVAIVGRDAGKAGAVAAELGERAFGVACDVSDGKQIESAIAAAEQATGGEADEIGRPENADLVGGKGLDLRPHRQQRALQAIAHEQDGHAEQQGGDRR